MVARHSHGPVARATVSSRDPRVLSAAPKPAARTGTASIGRAATGREELARLSQAMLDRPSTHRSWYQSRSLRRVLDWLELFPGEDWQDRWVLGEQQRHEAQWGPPDWSAAQRKQLHAGASILIMLGVVRPSYAWLFGTRFTGFYASFRRHNPGEEPVTFSAIEQQAHRRQVSPRRTNGALELLARIVIVTGKKLADLDPADFDDYTAARQSSGRAVEGLALAYECLHAAGGLRDHQPTLRQARARGQLSVADLVDQYPIADRDVRDVFVHYLVERSAMLDYGSLVRLVQVLVDRFWIDIERHHPGICSLQLPDPVAQAWKQRLSIRPNGQPRRTAHTVLFAVRSFYLDLQQWALEDPARWAPWAAPSPVRDADVRGYMKERRRRQARMQQRTRTLVPVLPKLVTAAEAHLNWSTRLLAAAREVLPGETFTVDGQRYRRIGRETRYYRPTALFVTPLDPADGQPGRRFDAERQEDNAFWTVAVVEVLRRTGTRIEELLELTHLSLRQYQAPTGEMVPLLQISPSKTDTERVIPADPDLVAVLARILRRIKDADGKVPVLSRYDDHERVFSAPLPHLFQHTWKQRREVIGPDRVRNLLSDMAARAGLADVDGTPLRFTPHDFRRVFSTEAVNSGLPIHIAAKLLGHLDLNTTQGYVAVYPEEVINHYRRFVDQRRTQRPGEEYREPTDTEWEEFRDHHSLRQVALGRCDRPYGTPCQHEHACIRCPMLRLSLDQAPRLVQIEQNTRDRLVEAHQMQWLGEVAALEESLRHIANKKQQVDRLRSQQTRGEAGPQALT